VWCQDLAVRAAGLREEHGIAKCAALIGHLKPKSDRHSGLDAACSGMVDHAEVMFATAAICNSTRDDLPASDDLAARFSVSRCQPGPIARRWSPKQSRICPNASCRMTDPLPYPKFSRRTPSDFQRTMRLDLDSALIPKQRKRANVDDGGQSRSNHHTKGIEARRIRVVRALKPGTCRDSLPATL
jgi:hypothetical protein